MRPMVLLLTVVMLAAADPPKEEVLKEELKKLEGAWEVSHLERAGQTLPDDKVKSLSFQVTFKGNKMTAKTAAGSNEATFEIDPSKAPKTLDTTDKKEKTEKGIYKIEGDTLTLCIAVSGERPADFATKTGSDHMMFKLKKGK